jgi:hypothetical protein
VSPASASAANRRSMRTGIGGSFQSEGGASGTSMTAGWVPHVRVAGRLLGAGFRGPSKRFTGRLRRDFRMPVAMQQQTAVRAALPPVACSIGVVIRGCSSAAAPRLKQASGR